jgi:hypothetical protein
MTTERDRTQQLDAMLAVVSAFRSFLGRSETDEVLPPWNPVKWNARLGLRLFFGLIAIRYLTTPFVASIEEYYAALPKPGHYWFVRSRVVYIFGVRVARWAVSTERREDPRYAEALAAQVDVEITEEKKEDPTT